MSKIAEGVLRTSMANANEAYRKAGRPEMQVKVRADGTIDRPPDPPAGLRAQQAGAGTRLFWDAARDDHGAVRSYQVLRDGKPVATVSGATSWTDTSATGPHDWQVRAIDGSGLTGSAVTLPLRERAAQQAQAAAQTQTSPAQQAQAAAAQVTPPQVPATATPGTVAAPGSSAEASAAGPAPSLAGLQRSGADAFQLSWKPVTGATAYGVWQDGRLLGHVPRPSFAARVPGADPTRLEIDAVLPDGRRTARTPMLVLTRGADGVQAQVSGAPSGPPATAAPSAPAAPAAPAAPTAPVTATMPAAVPAG